MSVRVGVVGACVCGHQGVVHQHDRPGTDCSLCLGRACVRFRPAEVPPISNGRAFLAALLVVAGLYVVVLAAALLRDLP